MVDYVLFHKENPVLQFSLDVDFNIIAVSHVCNADLIPVGITKAMGKSITQDVDEKKFDNWWKNRSIPIGRKNLENAFKILKVKTKEQLIDKTHSFNLIDHYWIKKVNDDVTWEKCNFFQNNFDDTIGEYLLLERHRTFSAGTYNSPDLFTDGMLPKKWMLVDNERFLLKGTESSFQQEPFNEVLASYLCHRLGISHARYLIQELKSDDGEVEYFSLCKNFIDVHTELIPAYDVTKVLKKMNNESVYQHFLRCCNALGIQNIEDDLQKMLAVDFIIANTDRHLRNFGFIRNADTLEWLGLAPVYDSEKSLFLNKVLPKTSYAAIDIPARPFKDNQAEQFNLLDRKNLKSLPLENVSDIPVWFDSLLQKNVFISKERRTLLCENLKNRIQGFTYLVENDKKIPITKNKHRRTLDKLQGLSLVFTDIF